MNLLDHRGGTSWQAVNKQAALKHVALRVELVKSITLGKKLLTTAKTLLPYDLLVLDRAPTYLVKELVKIESSVQKLILAIKSDPTRRATVRFLGDDVSTWQLALIVKAWLRKQAVQNIAVAVLPTPLVAVNRYLKENGLILELGKGPGVTIAAPSPILPASKLKGAFKDELGYLLSDGKAVTKGYRNVLVRDGEVLKSVNLWRIQQTRAKMFAAQLTRMVEGQLPKDLELERNALGLLTNNGVLTIVGRSLNQGFRAKAISNLDLRMWRDLLRRYH